MKLSPARTLLLTLAALAIIAVAAAPAHARITPAGSTVSANSRDSVFNLTFLSITCPTADITGTLSADGTSLSGRLAFSSSTGGARCRDNLGGVYADFVCRGSATFRSTSSTAGVSASGDLLFDRDLDCTLRSPLLGEVTFRGPQTLRGCLTFNQATQLLTVRCSLAATVSSNPMTITLSASYRVTTGRLTIS